MKEIVLILLICAVINESLTLKIDCDIKNVNFGDFKDINTCEIENEDLEVNFNDLISEIQPTTLEFDKINGITFENGIFYRFPNELGNIFKNLQFLKFRNVKLSEIYFEDLRNFPNLKYLDLQGNEIEILDENLFANNSHLEVINLSENEITHIDINIFDDLKNLKSLKLSDNKCELSNAISKSELTALINDINSSKCKIDKVRKLREKNFILKIENYRLTNSNKSWEIDGLSDENSEMSCRYENYELVKNITDLLSEIGNLKELIHATTEGRNSEEIHNTTIETIDIDYDEVDDKAVSENSSCENEVKNPTIPNYQIVYALIVAIAILVITNLISIIILCTSKKKSYNLRSHYGNSDEFVEIPLNKK
jgi:hypothetical protein